MNSLSRPHVSAGGFFRVRANINKVRYTKMRYFEKKVAEKLGSFRNSAYLCGVTSSEGDVIKALKYS